MEATYTLSQLVGSLGEEQVRALLSSFVCSRNLDIQDFVQNKALDFEKKGIATTYVVISVDESSGVLTFQAIFTPCLKSVDVYCSSPSKTTSKAVQRFGELDHETGICSIPAILIAQFGKNNLSLKKNEIAGDHLMSLALSKASNVHSMVGGRFVYLECEEHPELISFYKDAGFRAFGERISKAANTGDSERKLIRLFRFVK